MDRLKRGRYESLRDQTILTVGEELAEQLTLLGESFHQISTAPAPGRKRIPPPYPTVRGRNVSLGAAWLSLRIRGIDPWHPGFIAALKAKFLEIVADPPTESQRINRKTYSRWHYYRTKERILRRHEAEWSAELRDFLKQHYMREIADSRQEPLSVEEEVHGEIAAEAWLQRLTESERRAIEDIVNGTPTSGDADRTRRSRARRKLRDLMSEDPFVRRS